MQSSKILILYTGGTIGMQPSDAGYVIERNLAQNLSQHMILLAEPERPVYDFHALDTLLDSSNMTPDLWALQAEYIAEHWHQYCGFVVLHGTDTLAYTAAALAYIFAGIDKPIIVTGSQIPLSMPRTDAWDNVLGACLLAQDHHFVGVGVFFDRKLMHGTRVTKLKSQDLDAFYSPNTAEIAHFGINICYQKSKEVGELPTRALASNVPNVPKFREQAVTVVLFYPGITSQQIHAQLSQPDLQAAVLLTYGAGNPPDALAGFADCLQQAQQQGVILVNITQCPYGGVSQGSYAVSAVLQRYGVLSGADMTLEAAFTKLHYLLAQYPQDIKQVRDLFTRTLCRDRSD